MSKFFKIGLVVLVVVAALFIVKNWKVSMSTNVVHHNKLVRDRIPEIIKGFNKHPEMRILTEQECVKALETKLDEEVGEYHKDKTVEELADILEVVYALAQTHGVSIAELEQIRKTKAEKNGAFKERVFLAYVETK